MTALSLKICFPVFEASCSTQCLRSISFSPKLNSSMNSSLSDGFGRISLIRTVFAPSVGTVSAAGRMTGGAGSVGGVVTGVGRGSVRIVAVFCGVGCACDDSIPEARFLSMLVFAGGLVG